MLPSPAVASFVSKQLRYDATIFYLVCFRWAVTARPHRLTVTRSSLSARVYGNTREYVQFGLFALLNFRKRCYF